MNKQSKLVNAKKEIYNKVITYSDRSITYPHDVTYHKAICNISVIVTATGRINTKTYEKPTCHFNCGIVCCGPLG